MHVTYLERRYVMDNQKVVVENKKGLGLASILTIIFVVAKLFGLVAWSWWIVFSPLLVVFGLIFVILFFALIFFIGAAIYEARK